MSEFGDLLRQKREEARLTQKDLARQLSQKIGFSIHDSVISRWETGARIPETDDREAVIGLADVFGIDDGEKNRFLITAGLAPLRSHEMNVDDALAEFGKRYEKVRFLKEELGWIDNDIGNKFDIRSFDVRRDLKLAYEVEEARREGMSKADLRRRHLERIYDQVGILRSCLLDPQFETIPYSARPPLDVMGQDWRLDPTTWLKLCTPDFSDPNLWGSDFPSMRQHMGNSPFFANLKALAYSVRDLEQKYADLSATIAAREDAFGSSWQAFQDRKIWRPEPSRTPASPRLEDLDYEPYYGAGYCQNVLAAFYELDPDLPSYQCNLEEQLQQLNNDLLPDTIEPIIESGHCDQCP
ncbi:MAG: helix-turn-helix transcriptional regulator [Dehalococcoidia bacterium]